MNKLKLIIKLIGILIVFFLNIDTTLMESIDEQDIDAKYLVKTYIVFGVIIFSLLYISEGRDFSQIFDYNLFKNIDPLTISLIKQTWKKIFK